MALLAVGLWCYVVANGKLVLRQSSVCLQPRPQGIIIKGWLFLLLLPFSDQDLVPAWHSPDPPLLLTIGKQSELEGISCCLPPGLDNPPSAINILSPTLTHVWRECKLEKTFDMLLQFSGHFNPWLLPGRFPSMALTSSPCPDIALIVSWHTRHCVPHCDQTPFRIVRTEQQMLQAFSKEPTHWPAAASQSARESKKEGKEPFVGGFCALQSLYSCWRGFTCSWIGILHAFN